MNAFEFNLNTTTLEVLREIANGANFMNVINTWNMDEDQRDPITGKSTYFKETAAFKAMPKNYPYGYLVIGDTVSDTKVVSVNYKVVEGDADKYSEELKTLENSVKMQELVYEGFDLDKLDREYIQAYLAAYDAEAAAWRAQCPELK